MELVWPSERYLASYVSALERGWSPDNARGEAAAREHLRLISKNPAGFLAKLVDREAKGPPLVMLDGSIAPRLPGYHRWIWDGEFCGRIGFRWQPGTCDLPPHVLGHIGYTVVAWKQGRGYAKQALKLLLEDVKSEGLSYVEIITNPNNIPSQRVILANGGVLVERFNEPDYYGGKEALRYRIEF